MPAILDKAYREGVLGFLQSNYMGKPGQYRYSAACSEPTLYSSTYAAMTLSLLGPADGGAMFPTWFRTLTLALTAKALTDEPVQLVRCPGMQFDV